MLLVIRQLLGLQHLCIRVPSNWSRKNYDLFLYHEIFSVISFYPSDNYP